MCETFADTCAFTYYHICTIGLEQLNVTAEFSAGTGVTISWSYPVEEVCPCVNYTISINDDDLPNDVPCNQSSLVIGSEELRSRVSNCTLNNVSVVPRSAIGPLKNLSGHEVFIYGPFGKLHVHVHG